MRMLLPTPVHLDRDGLVAAYDRPAGQTWCRLVFVASVDGSVQGADGLSGPLGGPGDAEVFALQRSLADVVLVAAGTARAEGMQPVRVDEVDAPLRQRLGLSPTPPLAVVSTVLDLPTALLDVPADPTEAPTLVVTCAAAPHDRLAALRDQLGERLIVVGDQTVDLAAALVELASRGLRRVVCEGGPSLAGALISADLVDELCLSTAPVLVGGTGPRLATGATTTARPLQLGHVIAHGAELFTRWVVADNRTEP